MDKKEIGALIRLRRKTAGVGRKEIASILGVDLSYVTKIEKGTANYTINKFLKLAEYLKTPEYSFFSKAPLTSNDKEPAIIEIFPDQETKIEFEKLRTRDDFIPIRIVGTGALGQGRIVSSEETKGYTLIYRQVLPKGTEKRKRYDNPRIVCLYAEGDSMTPTIRDKSMVAIDIEDKTGIQNYGIYAVEIPDEGVTIKRVVKDGSHVILIADNKDTKGFPRALNIKTISYNPICGKVIWTWNRLD